MSMVKRSGRRPRLKYTGNGKGVVNHAGTVLLADVADKVGLTDGLSDAMSVTRQRRGGHDRGKVVCDLAVMLADDGKRISDLATLRDQPRLFGEVASDPTAWRALEAADETVLDRINQARANARATAWAAGVDPGFYVIDIDATLVGAHSEKEHAAPTYKRGFGFHPLMAYLDGTGEALAGMLRPGNAGSNTAADHVRVLDDALFQLPVDPTDVQVIMRADTAGCTHQFLEACVERDVRFVVGHELNINIAKVLVETPDHHWVPAVTPDGTEEREHAVVCELTGRVDLTGWPEGTRMIARREPCHPGAQLTFTDEAGHRFQVCVTNLADADIAYLEALYRGRGRVEQRIADAKDTGLANLPSASFAINQAWVTTMLCAQDLIAWTQLLCLNGELAKAQPKRLRYCLFHTAATVTRNSRQDSLNLSNTWPWTDQLLDAFDRAHHIRAVT